MLELKNRYKNIIINKVLDESLYKSLMQIPKIIKITINVGLGKHIGNKKIFDSVFKDIYLITGQKPILTRVKKSISSFKIRKDMIIGLKVTLRNFYMWNFLEKLIKIVIPRIRNFEGFTVRSFDKLGNFNFGIKDQSIFPEIIYDEIEFLHGLNINIVFSSNCIKENQKILSYLYFPFK